MFRSICFFAAEINPPQNFLSFLLRAFRAKYDPCEGEGPIMPSAIRRYPFRQGEQTTSRTPRRRPARVALHAGAVAHESKVAALRAHLALVALGFRFGAAFGLGGMSGCGRTRLAPLHRLELFRRREVVLRLLLQRDRALKRIGDAAMTTLMCAARGQRRHLAAA